LPFVRRPSVRPSDCLSLCKLLHFRFLLQYHWANFKQTGTEHLWGGGIKVFSNERDYPSPRGDNSEGVKIHWEFFKIISSRTSPPNSIKLGTNYPWVKGIQFCSNEGQYPLQRRDNTKNVKIWWDHLKIISRTTGPILTRLGTNLRWGRGFTFVQTKGIVPLQGDIIAKE
jgi:hypothetical protein